MGKRKLKAGKVYEVFGILKGAKCTSMTSDEKLKLWKLCRALSMVAEKTDADIKDATESFKAGFEDFDDKCHRAQEYKAGKGGFTKEEYEAFANGDWKAYSDLLSRALNEVFDKDVEVEFEPLTEQELAHLIDSNDWVVDVMIKLNLITE